MSKRGGRLGLNDDELAFYDALANNEASVRALGDEILAKIAHELTASLRGSVTVDWNSRESVRAKLRLLVKRILRKYKYPPDSQEEAAAGAGPGRGAVRGMGVDLSGRLGRLDASPLGIKYHPRMVYLHEDLTQSLARYLVMQRSMPNHLRCYNDVITG